MIYLYTTYQPTCIQPTNLPVYDLPTYLYKHYQPTCMIYLLTTYLYDLPVENPPTYLYDTCIQPTNLPV